MNRRPAARRPPAPAAAARSSRRRRPQDATLTRLRGERDLALNRARREAEFISHASHEIRTPLHGIMGFSTLLLSTELTEEQRSFASALHTGIESLLAVVNDVLDVSTLDAGGMQLESVRFNLLTLVRGVVETFSQVAVAKGLVLRVDTSEVKHPHLIGDPGRVRQILANFVSNAVKFTDAGEATVRAATRANGRGAVEVRIAVTDTGRGIPRHAQARLFQPFSRLHQPGLLAVPGTGLGLSISKQLVDLMGGRVTVKSSPGRGSTFAFTVSLGEDSPSAPRDLEPGSAGQLRVYVGDDDARSLSELLLSLAAIGVSVAGSGSATGLPEALRATRAAGHPPDIAIVGHVRHQGGDLAIARAVKADPRLARLPLVLAPVSGIRGHARDVRDAGYSAYVPRPFQGDELLRCLRAAVTQGQDRPIDDTRLITRHSVADDTTSPAPGRVLVADDDPASRHVVRLQIARLGYLVDEVSGGRDAVAAAATGRYQVILMDCQMPDMDGLAATAAIRRHEKKPGQRTHIVALTADVSARQRARCRKAGMDEFLEKPLRTQTLTGLLHRHLRRGHDTVAFEAAGITGRHATPDGSGTDLLEAEIGPEMTRELVHEYLAGVEQTIQRLSRSEKLDTAAVRSAAHRLLGGARVLGLARLERIWTALSEGGGDAGEGIPPAVIDDLRAACAELGARFDSSQRKQHA